MNDEIETFESALARVKNNAELANADLQDACKYIRTRFIKTANCGGWAQFLQEDGAPSSTGTACITSSLVRMGISRRDTQLVSAADFLSAYQRVDGGWSKPEFDEHLSITLISCLSLHSLAAVGIPSSEPVIDGGLRWVEKAQNPDGGWGQLARDERSDVTATAYALRALVISDSAAETFKENIERGADWIMRQQNSDGGWGTRQGEPPTLSHTAHAVEGLVACGYRRESQGPLADAYNWFLRDLPSSSLMPWVEHYHVPPPIKELLPSNLRSSRLRWSHLPAERSVIALLKLGLDPDSEIISTLVADISARHEKGKCWRVQTMPEVVASWAILEVTNALCPYVEALDSVGYRSAFRGVIDQVASRLAALEAQNREFKLQLESLNKQVAAQSRPLRSWIGPLHRFIMAPVTHAIALIASGIAILLLYLGLWSHGEDDGTRLIGVATIMVPVLALLEMIRRRRTE